MAIFTAFTAIGTAIGAVGAWVGTTFGVVGTFLLKTAVGIGVNLLAQAVAGKPKAPIFSINGTIQGGGDLPRSFIVGRAMTAGSLVWANSWGKDGNTPNGYLTQVIAVSDLPVKGLVGQWVNNEKVTIDYSRTDADGRGYPVTEYRKDGKDNLWIKFYDGNQTAADSFLVNRASNGNRRWTSDRVGVGIAYAIATARVSKNMFSGIPSFKFEIDGYRCYDISKDSSAGGSGAQRLGNPATWGGDGDYLPAVQMYNLLRGISFNGQWFYGVQGMSAARLPAASWIAAINKCRQPIQGASGPEPQYRSSGEITIDAPLTSALEVLNASCQGRISEIGGVYHMYVGAPDAPVIHFTDDDILSTEEQSFTPFLGLSDTINGVRATYPSPVDGWVVKTAPPLYRRDLEAKHGNRRLMASIELTFVPYAEQVQRLMNSALLEGQRARRHTHVLSPKFWAYAVPGVVFSWTSKRNGYVNKLLRVDGAADRANLDVMVDLTEVDPSDYAWQSSTDFQPPVDGAVGPMRPLPQPIVDFYAQADVAQDNNGNNRRCAVRLGWDGDKDDVDFVRFEVRIASTLGVIYSGRAEDVARGSILIAPGTLLPNELYGVRAWYDTYAGNRDFEKSDWIAVRTLDIKLGPLDIYPISVDQQNKDINDLQKWVGDSLRYAREEMERLGAIAAEQDAGNYFDKKQLRTELSNTAEGLRYDYSLQIVAAFGPGSALVSRIESLEVQVNDDIAGAVDLLQIEITKVDERITATARSVTALSATVNDVSANLSIRGEVVAAPDGWSSRYAIQVGGGSGGVWSNAAFFMDVNSVTGISRVVFNADQVIFTNGVDSQAPMTFINGGLALRVADIGDVTAGVMRSPDNKVVFSLINKTLIFRDDT